MTHEVVTPFFYTFFVLLGFTRSSFAVIRVVGEDDFFADLGISYKDFDMPDEVDDYYEAKEDPAIAKDM